MKVSEAKTKGAPLVEVRAKRTRENILKAGLDSILAGGVQGFTANELMRRTGLSKGALFHHFSSLDEVAIECVQYGGHLLTVETKGTLRESLDHLMTSVHGQRRLRALNVLLFFFCEKARDESRFKRTVQHLNDQRMQNLRDLLDGFLPKQKPEVVDAAVKYLHTAQMGLAGAAGDCLSNQERLRAWATVVSSTLAMLEAA